MVVDEAFARVSSGIAAEELKKLGYQKIWDMQVLERWDEKAQ